jgi:N-(2-amino-2-carboxyethyl)-L-glutamate synthase
VTVITDPTQFNVDDLFVDLGPVVDHRLFLKCEGFNFAGSVKLKAAIAMVEDAERDGRLNQWSILVESSSGNLGVALAIVAASKGYRFLCVTDPRCNETTRRLIEALGSGVYTVTEPHPSTGFLGARLDHIRALCAGSPRYVWLNQYSNPENPTAHYRTTAPSIAREFPALDVLFVGAGTTGTLMGCASWFRRFRPDVHVVAVDAAGSVSFGQPAGRRLIPGLGMSVPPPQLDASLVHDVVHVDERDTVRACHRLASRGYLFGGSTGTVVSGAKAWLDRHDASRSLTAVAIAPDLGERYLDTVYSPSWVGQHFGEAPLTGPEPVTGARSA